MKKLKTLILLLFILIFSVHISAEEPIRLKEETLIELIKATPPPSIQQLESSFQSAQFEHLSQKDKLTLRLELNGNYFESDERLLSPNDGGVTRDSSSFNVGLVKPTQYGLELGVKAFSEKKTNAFINNATTSGLSFSLSLDLYQDFLGRRTRRELNKSLISSDRAKLEQRAQEKAFETNLRKLYWALVANNEQKKILDVIVDLSKKQYQDIRNRARSQVADAGDVARARSQWSSKEASLLAVQYSKSQILKEMRELLPNLEQKEVILLPYSLDQTVAEVLTCAAVIDSHDEAPTQFTVYAGIVKKLYEEEKLESKTNETYDDPSIKLVGEYSAVGRDFSYQESRDDLRKDPQSRSSIGLNLSIPLDGRKNKSKTALEKITRAKYQAQARSNLAKVKAFHTETANLIRTLRTIVQKQRDTNQYLGESLKSSQRKYNQARISLQDLISEQDTQLQSRLNEIDTNLNIINVLMDYFSIYNDIPCELNRGQYAQNS
jgi:outer membrane protein TolC